MSKILFFKREKTFQLYIIGQLICSRNIFRFIFSSRISLCKLFKKSVENIRKMPLKLCLDKANIEDFKGHFCAGDGLTFHQNR